MNTKTRFTNAINTRIYILFYLFALLPRVQTLTRWRSDQTEVSLWRMNKSPVSRQWRRLVANS